MFGHGEEGDLRQYLELVEAALVVTIFGRRFDPFGANFEADEATARTAVGLGFGRRHQSLFKKEAKRELASLGRADPCGFEDVEFVFGIGVIGDDWFEEGVVANGAMRPR